MIPEEIGQYKKAYFATTESKTWWQSGLIIGHAVFAVISSPGPSHHVLWGSFNTPHWNASTELVRAPQQPTHSNYASNNIQKGQKGMEYAIKTVRNSDLHRQKLIRAMPKFSGTTELPEGTWKKTNSKINNMVSARITSEVFFKW